MFDRSARKDDTFERSDFTYVHDDDSYICPGGNRRRPSNRNFKKPLPRANADGFVRCRAREKDCSASNLKGRCTSNLTARKIMRSIHEGACVVSRRQRKKVEMLFAHLKPILKLDRLRLRGPNGAKDKFHSPPQLKT